MRLDSYAVGLTSSMLPSRAAERARSIRAWNGYARRTERTTDTIYLNVQHPGNPAHWWAVELDYEILLSLCMN